MCRLLGYCSRKGAASLGELLGEDALREFTRLSAYHRDGWGMAWYDGQHPRLEKSRLAAAEDGRYAELAHRRLGDLGLLHLRRATPGVPIRESNSHPFRNGTVMMAHNGAIYPQSRLAEMLPQAWEQQLTGSTDSERYFLHVMSRAAAHGGDMLTALAETTAHIDHLFQATSLNAVFTTADALYAVCWYDPGSIPCGAVAQQGYQGPPERYFDLAYLQTPGAVVVASSGWQQAGWTWLPNRHVLVVDRTTLLTTVKRLDATRQPLPSAAPATAGC